MKRTALVFGIAGIIGLVALVVAFVPMPSTPSVAPPAPTPPVVLVPTPTPPPVPPAPGPQTAGDVLKLSASISDPYLLVGGEREAFLEIDLEAARIATSGRAPVNLAVVLDRSGSMAGEKIEQCRRAARHLVEQLDGRDRFALITFGSDVTPVIGSTLASPAAKAQMLRAIDGISELGGTNISGGLEAAQAELAVYRSQYNVSRIVLLSDGQANEGITDAQGLSRLARRVSSQGVTLSAIGVGLDFNELILESLAEYGGGGYHFLADVGQLPKIFARELEQAVSTVAIGPALTLAPQPGVRIAEVYGYLAEPQGQATVVRLPDFAAGQSRRIVVRLLVSAQAEGLLDLAQVSLAYLDVTRNRAPGSAAVAVKAAVTSDARLAADKRDKDVAAAAAHAEAIQTLRKAGVSFSQGKRDEAERMLDLAKNTLRRAEADFGPDEGFEKALGEAKAFEDSLDAPAGSAQRSRAAKRLHSFSNTAR